MSFIPIPRGVTLCFIFGEGGQAFQFCLTLQKITGTPTPTDRDNINNDAANWWTASLKPLTNSATALNEIVTTDQTSEGGPQTILNVGGSVGTASGSAVPQGTALVVSHRTALRGRSYRGRSYVGGLSTTHVASPTDVNSTYATNLGVAFTALAAALAIRGFNHVVASKQHNGIATNPATVNPVTAYIIDTHFDSQRRRLFGRGS